ncbi:hypothetical protein [Leptospira mayottensis]|uniref:hypothetical protein n=1 Tax=Leptospira mayottensis TaxID=1137606 RepID=UPI000E359BC9|nr:hypothetical protein [Leptospira mayottensis]AXR67759.1 hypothetical protein DPV73_06765 [Leptospira mayottensis]
MAKKDLLKQAAGAHVRKTLGGEIRNEQTFSESKNSSSENLNENSIRSEIPDSFEKKITEEKSDIDIPTEKNEILPKTLEEKHLPKKNHLHRISSVMRLEDYTKPESTEREGSSRFLKIAGIILLALAIWFFWPAKHEIYMDIDKMTPEKVSGMSSQKEYHFSHGQDFFIYYKKGWSTPKRVRLAIYRTDGGKEEFSVQEKDFRKSFEKFQTYYDDTFFDQQGSYEVEIRDEDGELLVNKKFTID